MAYLIYIDGILLPYVINNPAHDVIFVDNDNVIFVKEFSKKSSLYSIKFLSKLNFDKSICFISDSFIFLLGILSLFFSFFDYHFLFFLNLNK